MINIQTVRKLLTLADVNRDPYTIAEAAAALLEADGTDISAVTHYVRALMALGLHGAARRALTHFAPHSSEVAGQVGGLLGQLPAQPSGVIPWSSRRRRFQANVKALMDRDSGLASLGEAWDAAASRYELHQSADGNYHIFDLTQAPLTGWLGKLQDHKAATGLWSFDPRQAPLPHPVAFDGIGHGWLLQHVAASTEHSFLQYSCALYVLEEDPIAFALALHLQDFQSLARHPRVRWFIGPQALARFEADALAHRAETLPRQFIVNRLVAHAGPYPFRERAELLVAQRDSERFQTVERNKTFYADKPAAYWGERFKQGATCGPPLKILGVTTRYSTVLKPSMEELAAAIRAAGHPFRLVEEPDDHCLDNGLPQAIEEFKPDLIVQLSRMRYECPLLPANVPFLCWDQDNLPCMRSGAATASLDRLTFVAGHGAFHGFCYLNWPKQNCIFTQLAGAAHRYAARPVTADELAQYSCDVSYVSNASGSPEQLRDQLAPGFAGMAAAHAAYLFLTEHILSGESKAWGSSAVHALLDAAPTIAQVPPQVREELVIQALKVADRAFRHQALRWVALYCQRNHRTLKLYGRGWEKNDEFAAYAAGPAEPGAQMLAIYLASKINLQLIETGFIHSRSLDGLAAGAFFLTRSTTHDEESTPLIEARLRLAQHAIAHEVKSFKELLGSLSPALEEDWRRVGPTYHADAGGELYLPEPTFRSLLLCAEKKETREVFPQYDSIAFDRESTCHALLNRFLTDDALRQTTALAMQKVAIEHFSYDARWKTFLAGITRALQRPA